MTFEARANNWLLEIASRNRNPVANSTVKTYRDALNTWILPRLGSLDLSAVNNKTVKPFVASLCTAKLSPAHTNKILTVVKMVVKSAVDENGDQLYPRTWNNTFLDTPVICHADQNTPVVTPEAITAAILGSQGRDRALYALLAGSGLRIAEALSLGVYDGGGNYWDPAEAKVVIRPGLAKTDAGAREIDLSPELNAFLIKHIQPTRVHGLIWPFDYTTMLRRMQRLGIQDGFHAFRRFRITHLRKSHVPSGLVQFWAGHSDSASVTDGYDKIKLDVETRKTEAARVGLGFELETA